MTVTHEDRILRFLYRNRVEAVTALYLLPIIWGSLIPFDFSFNFAFSEATRERWIGLLVSPWVFPDLAANLLLYVPLGLLLRASLLRRGIGPALSLLWTVMFAAALSYLVEYSQQFSPSRFCSLADFAVNTAGALIGAALWSVADLTLMFCRRQAAVLLADWEDGLLHRPSGIVAGIGAVALFIGAVAPFDLTTSPDHMIASLGDARLVPFNNDARMSDLVWPRPDSGPAIVTQRRALDRSQLTLDYLTIGVGYLLFAALTARYLARHCRVIGFRRYQWTLAVCALHAILCQAARLVIASRTADMTEVVIALLAGLAGVSAADFLAASWGADDDRPSIDPPDTRRRLLQAAFYGWCVLVVGRQLAPFTPRLDLAAAGEKLAQVEWLPMYIYQRTRLPIAIDDLVSKFSCYAIWAALLGMLRVAAHPRDRLLPVFATAGRMTAVILVLEMAQLFIPLRQPSLTDLLLALAGAAFGVVAFRLTWVAYRRFLEQNTRTTTIMFNVELPPSADAPEKSCPVSSVHPRIVRPRNARPLNARSLNARPLNARSLNARSLNARPLNARPLNARPLNAQWPAIGRRSLISTDPLTLPTRLSGTVCVSVWLR